MEYENKIIKLLDKGCLTTKEVVKNNIPKIYLTKLVRKGKIERIGRGIYIKTGDIISDYFLLQSKSKNAIFSGLTALYLHGFVNRIPIIYDITIPNGYNGSLQNNDIVNLHYVKRNLLDLGLINYELEKDKIIRIYDLERSICDIIKNKDKLDLELVNKSLRDYFYSTKKDTIKLYDYAKKMNIYKKVKNTLEVLK